jgi:hypothetical protein
VPSDAPGVSQCERDRDRLVVQPVRDQPRTNIGKDNAHAASSDDPGPLRGSEVGIDPVIRRPEYSKVVYDNPNPNSYRGVTFFCAHSCEPEERGEDEKILAASK